MTTVFESVYLSTESIILEKGLRDSVIALLKRGVSITAIASALFLPIETVANISNHVEHAASNSVSDAVSKDNEIDFNTINWNKFIDALVSCESRGSKKINGKYFGDPIDGIYMAYGPLQIWKKVIDDVNRVAKTSYTHEDAHDLKKATDICKIYLTYWGKRAEKKLNRKLKPHELAMIWNGGPGGYRGRNDDVIVYGKKFIENFR